MSELTHGSAESIAGAIEEIKRDVESLKVAMTALAPLAKEANHLDLAKLEKAIQAAAKKIQSSPGGSERGQALLDEVREGRDARKKALREQLAPDLKAACAKAEIPLRVVSREHPLKLRLAPFGVIVDREKGSATIEFAQTTLEHCAADAGAIIAARASALKSMGSFDHEAFFQSCLKAWKAAVATGNGGSSKRVEITAFMPYLVLEMQGAKFRKAPTASEFVEYGRAHFAFDVMRLREGRQLIQDGWRMNLGVATGTTASSNAKSKVIWIEDSNGEGEYKLNVFFTRQGGAFDE